MIRFSPRRLKAGGVLLHLSLAAFGAVAQSGTEPAKPSIDAGRQLFGAHCARCHGADATGSADAPNLLPRVKGMSEAAFSSAVLQRYRWSIPAPEAAGESTGLEAMLRGVLSRQQGDGAMPAWESQPSVAQGVRDLYAYLIDRGK